MPDNDRTRLPEDSNRSNLLIPGQDFGQYKVVRLLGRGGMGEVYEVEHSVLHKSYALKVIRPEVLNRPTAAERFKREAQVMSHLEHPNIVAVDEFGETEGHTWLRMPLLGKYVDQDGRLLQSLEDRMSGDRVLPEAEVLHYLEQILSALDYAHAKGAVHRDIKPSNILFDQTGGLKIADFGLVHMAGEEWLHSQVQLTVAQSMAQPADIDTTRLESGDSGKGTSTQALLGTFEYMAPEQKKGGAADARSDLYAVGLMAFRMLTGESVPGFKGPSRINPELPADWDDWVERAMESRPEARFASAAEMLEALPADDAVGAEEFEDGSRVVAPEEAILQKPEVLSEPEVLPNAEEDDEPVEVVGTGDRGSSGRRWLVLIVLLLSGGAGVYFLAPVGTTPSQALVTPANPISRETTVSKPVQPVAVQQEPVLKTQNVASPESGRDLAVDLGGVEAIKLKWIGPGSFQMGSNDGNSNEKPVHRVTLTKGYWLGETELTQGQWQSVMGNNPSNFKGSNLPVEKVSWEDAMEFCRKLTERERAAGRLPAGLSYTLPTEAQWEYACRAGTTGAYAEDLDAMAWYEKNSGSKTHPVGTKRANGWGLYDMHGNVWEWCSDWYGDYPSGSVVDPAGANSGSFRGFRGGCWFDGAGSCRSAYRFRITPGRRSYILGFRLALTVNH